MADPKAPVAEYPGVPAAVNVFALTVESVLLPDATWLW